MSIKTCIRPNCNTQLTRHNSSVCRDHWSALPEDIKNRYPAAYRAGLSAVGSLNVEAIQYFKDNMIGDNDPVNCGAPGCDGRVVWMDGRFGRLPIDADTVEADHTCYLPKKHTRHRTTCKNPDYFAQRRSLSHYPK